MTTSTRTKGTSMKRMTGMDGSMKYQSAIGVPSGMVAAFTMLSLMSKKSSKTKQVVCSAVAMTATAIVADKAAKRYYTRAEYGIILATSLIGFTIVVNAGDII